MKMVHLKIAIFVNGCSQILKGEASLLATLEEMYILSLKLFFNSLNCQANKLLDKVGPNSENPPAMH